MQWWCASTGLPWDWRWQWYPGVHLFLVLLAAGWWILGKRQQWPSRPWLPFVIAWVLLLLTFDWPLGKLGAGYLASAHTAQFVLLTGLIAPALLRSIPEAGWLRWAERRGRDGRPGLRPHPLLCVLVYNVVIVVTHFPSVVDPAMKTQWGSFLIDFAWLFAGLALWWPILAPKPLRRLSVFQTMGYILLSTVVPTIPAMMMIFARWPLYELYELAPRFSVHFTANSDLQLAGFLMKLIGELPLWFAAGLVFFTRNREDHA